MARADTTATTYRSEAAWSDDVRSTATRFGWLHWHHHRSIGTRAGLPDLELVHARRGVHARVELKTDKTDSRLSVPQIVTLDVLARTTTSHLAVWRPSDRDAVDAFLARGGWAVDWEGTSWRNPGRRVREIRRLSDAELVELLQYGAAAGVRYLSTDPTFSPEFCP